MLAKGFQPLLAPAVDMHPVLGKQGDFIPAVAVQIRHFHADGGEGQILTAEAGSVIALIAKLRVQIHLALGGLVVHEIRVHLIDHGRAAGVGGRGRDRPAEEIGVDRIRNILEGGDEVIDRALDVLAPFPAFRP